jgi:hypothetical protein
MGMEKQWYTLLKGPHINIIDILDVMNVTYKYLFIHNSSDTYDKFNIICV